MASMLPFHSATVKRLSFPHCVILDTQGLSLGHVCVSLFGTLYSGP